MPELSTHIVESVARLSRVPGESLAGFGEALRGLVVAAVCLHNTRATLQDALRAQDGLPEMMIQTSTDLARANRELVAYALQWLAAHQRWKDAWHTKHVLAVHAALGLPEKAGDRIAPADHPLAPLVRQLLDPRQFGWDAAFGCEELAASTTRRLLGSGLRSRKARRRGRPQIWDEPFTRFVAKLLSVAKDAGGHITFSRDCAPTSALWKILQLLAPSLPQGFVPRIPPSRKLSAVTQRHNTVGQKISRAV